jgi:hypothetical protein
VIGFEIPIALNNFVFFLELLASMYKLSTLSSWMEISPGDEDQF